MSLCSQRAGHTSPHVLTTQTQTYKSVFSSHPDLPPISSTFSPTSFPLNIASSKPSLKHLYHTKDLNTSPWYQTRPPQRLTNKSPGNNDPQLSTKSVVPLHTNLDGPLSTTKSENTVLKGPSDPQGNGAAKASPPILGRPHECSHLVGGTGSNAGGSSNHHPYQDSETPICQVCISCFFSKK